MQQTIPYVYGDSTWKDKLTSYNGQAISYDAIGNPLSDGTWTYTWQAGRQLKKMTKSGMTVEFKYDHNGLRTQKKVTQNGVTTTTNYMLHGKLVTHMTIGADTLHFFYDAQSRPTKVNFNGTVYTYLHNLQGDIVGIVDGNGTLVVEYNYDAWGKPLSTIGTKAATLGKLNPFRYRGYVYDEETGLYYLRSRYYHPAWGRFINSDALFGKSGALLSHNLFPYCKNNPVVQKDPDGFDDYSIDGNGSARIGVPTYISLTGPSILCLAFAETSKRVHRFLSKTILRSIDLNFTYTKEAESDNESSAKLYTVYVLEDATGTERYVGRVVTAHYSQRMKYHEKYRGLTPKYRVDNLTKWQCRGLEQIGMMYFHTIGSFPNNVINGIRLSNPNRDRYLSAAYYLMNQVENEALNFLE